MATPEIRAGLIAKHGFIFNELLFKQHSGLERIQAQHTLAKTVNGEDGRFIHLPFSEEQPLGCLLLIGNLFQKARVERVIRALTQTGDAQLVDIAANTAPQLSGGSLGEGHHQQLLHAQRAWKSGVAAKPQQQTQVQGGNGEGFSRSR